MKNLKNISVYPINVYTNKTKKMYRNKMRKMRKNNLFIECEYIALIKHDKFAKFCILDKRNKKRKSFIKISCELKRNILRMFKILLCQNFTYNFETCIITFNNKVNNNKDFNRIKNLCYYYDVNFKYINNYQIEIIY